MTELMVRLEILDYLERRVNQGDLAEMDTLERGYDDYCGLSFINHPLHSKVIFFSFL